MIFVARNLRYFDVVELIWGLFSEKIFIINKMIVKKFNFNFCVAKNLIYLGLIKAIRTAFNVNLFTIILNLELNLIKIQFQFFLKNI